MTQTLIIDISHHNTIYSFEYIAAKIPAVICKTTQGTAYVDPRLNTYRNAATHAGMLVGYYHFLTNSPIDLQVSHFLSNVGDYKKALLALDYEEEPNGNTASLDQAREFLKLVYSKTGKRPILYGGHLLKEKLGTTKDDFLAQHRLWLSQYGPKAVIAPAWLNFWLWQYTDGGKVSGITGKVDLNVYYNDLNHLKIEWYQ